MKEEGKILIKKVMVIALPIIVLLGTALLVSGNGFGLGTAGTAQSGAQGSGCPHHQP